MIAPTSSKAFLESCGSTGPMGLGVEEPGVPGTSWRVFDRPFVVAGRDPGADLPLREPAVSRRHAYFQRVEGRTFCVDLRSRTGTRWGDEPGLWGWVAPGPGVGVGAFRIRPMPGGADPGEPGDPLPIARSSGSAPLAEATLEFLGPAIGPSSWRLSRTLVLLGGSPACKVRLRGEGVAEIHASLVRTRGGVWVVDLLGPGGVLLNGSRARFARLEDGDVLGIGPHEIRVRCGPSALPDRARPPEPRAAPDGLAPADAGDPSRQSLTTALRSLAAVHRGQTAMILEELAAIRRLTEEQGALHAEIAGRGRAAIGPPTLRLVSGDAVARPGAATPGPTLALPTPAGDPAWEPRPPSAPAGPRQPPPPTSGPTGPGPTGPPATRDDPDFHARIVERLAAVRDERRGRWQKLLTTLLGKGG